MKIKIAAFITIVAFFASCNDFDPTVAPEVEPEPEPVEYNATIDVNTSYQTIESFSASDAWLGHFIGKYWSDDAKEGIAKLLFSQNMGVGGQPEGIGLSGWRFNLGAGTENQGDASGIYEASSILKRAESFMDPSDGSLDWTKQAGQQYFLEKARDYGCEQFVMFSNSPPVYLTKNGYGFSTGGSNANIDASNYNAFANYVTTVIDWFETNKGITFDYYSPVNEPQYNWTVSNGDGQEGSPWQNSEIAAFVTVLDQAITDAGVSTKIMLAESGAWNYIYEDAGYSGRANVLNDMFTVGAANNVTSLQNVAQLIAAHSYWTDGNWNTLVETRNKVYQEASAKGLKTYQTEWSMLDGHFLGNDGFPSSYDDASYQDIALWMSKVIHCDLTYARVSSWSYWTAMGIERWSQKNRFMLINTIPGDGAYGSPYSPGTYEAMKTLWVLGNYSLFVRPGYQHIGLTAGTDSYEFFGNAFISPDRTRLVVVYTNTTDTAKDITADIGNLTASSVKTYTTSETDDLKPANVASADTAITIGAKSVVTVVYELE